MADFRPRLGIGTVQFGLDYGISNKAGKTSQEEVRSILEIATKNSINIVDTARLYGDSETVLGSNMSENHNFKIVTKTIPIKKAIITSDDREAVRQGIEKSFRELKTENIYGLLLHHADDLYADGGEGIYEDLLKFKTDKKIQKIGVSAYDTAQIEAVLSRYDIDIVQVPVNIFDQRMVHDGTLKKLADKGIEIHARSAFLQGIAFMAPENLPSHLEELKDPLGAFIETCRKYGLNPAAGALAFLMGVSEIGTIICGVNTPAQLKELCHEAANLPVLPKDCFDNIAVDRADLVNPALWNKAS